MDYEVKAVSLEESFEAAGASVEVAQLRREVALLRQARRPALDGAKGAVRDEGRVRFVDGYLRKGLESGLELKALAIGTDPAGGFAVPREIDAMIANTLRDISPIRRVANVVAVGSANYRKLIATGGFATGWATGPEGARPETATPTFREIVPPMGDLYANPAASQAMLDDAAFDVETWLSGEVAREFARAEGLAFVSGTGVGQPKGFTTYATVTTGDATRPFGTMQHLLVPAPILPDNLIDLVYAVKPAYRQGAVFVMNSATSGRIRKVKDTTGQFLFQPSLVLGQPATLLGYPIVEAEDMPDVATGNLPVAFGNFEAGYVVAERTETAILRDPFTNKPFVQFYATKRVGGAVVNSEAIKFLKIS